jgi:HPt (histidine-containing phosphotransfer) domain-containing protein
LKYLRSICDNDQRFMKEMIVTFLELTPILIAQMQILSKEGKWHELGKTAHQLKPSLQFMGMDPARNKVKEIEDICMGNPDHSLIVRHIQKLEKDCIKAFAELNGMMKKEFVSV